MRLSIIMKLPIITVLTALLAGCASQGDPRDPLEPMNRAVYRFNEYADKTVIKPMAEAWKENLPKPVQTGVRNFFSNLDDVVVFGNDLLQFKPEHATQDFLRVTFNTTFGIAGVLDVASEMGLPKHNEDFGQTLGAWGLSDGPYLVLPLIGPSSLRDATGRFVDINTMNPIYTLDDMGTRNQVIALDAFNRRVELLGAKDMLDAAALNPYEFTRDFYLERRASLVRDGRPAPHAE
jgi:phospholipid-binding lipoprotein MlaA